MSLATDRSLFELVLDDDERLTHRLLDDGRMSETLAGLLALAFLGFAAHGATALLLPPAGSWTGMFELPVGMLLALALCLPSFWFFTQLAGLDASFRAVTALSLRVLARTAIWLLGALPFFMTLVLLAELDVVGEGAVHVGWFALPMVMGLAGARSLLKGMGHLEALVGHTHERRGAFLWRLAFCWCAVYATVAMVSVGWLLFADVLK